MFRIRKRGSRALQCEGGAYTAALRCLSSRIFLDISNRQSISTAFEKVSKIVNGIDGLINNAGIFNQLPLIEAPEADFDSLINTNVLGMYNMVKTFFPLIYNRKGRIINISSETALKPK